MRLNELGVACLVLALAGCGSGKSAAVAEAPPYNNDIPMNEVMAHVVSPAAFQFWSGWGFVSDSTGIHDKAPKNEAEWKTVEDGAAGVALAMNVIMTPGYARAPESDWYRYAQAVQRLALQGKAAAERQDKNGIGEVGAQLDGACEACHLKFVPPVS